MSLNWKSIMKVIGSLASPKQAVAYLLDKIAGNDPKLAESLKRMYTSGEDPTKVLAELSSENKITLSQFQQIRKCYGIARKLGMKHQIPEAEWVKAEKVIRENSHRGDSGFTGF